MDALPAGLPCWYELGTPDLVGAGEFYGKVMDWTVTGSHVTEIPYTLAVVNNEPVAGLMLVESHDGAPPPGWIPHFSTPDCAATVEAITAAGGSIIRERGSNPGIGIFAIMEDPFGAVCGVMEMPDHLARTSAGARRNWHELMTHDPEAAMAFYGTVFGWTTGETYEMPHVGTAQTIVDATGATIGSVMAISPEAPQSVWLAYFGVDDMDETLRRIGLVGGSVMHGPADTPDGRVIAVAADPQRAWFATVGQAEAPTGGPRGLPVRSA